jgi:hypothetical protein
MTPWQIERDLLISHLKVAEERVRSVHADPKIWHRVRQSAQRALEQIEVAMTQLAEQEAPL